MFYVDNLGDTVVEFANAGAGGVDTVRSLVSFVLGNNVENLTLLGGAAIDATGNGIGNTLMGNDAANVIDGNAGNDTIQAGGGDDRLFGRTGSDTIDGGLGQDTAVYAGDLSTFVITTSAGSIQIKDGDSTADGNEGTDTLIGVETAEFKGGATVNLLAPIVLDLDGDGIELVDLAESSARFDFDGDGRTTLTGWIGNGDALLVLDRDGNGTVTDASEISFVGDKPGARSDLDGLGAFDTNGDAILSAADHAFARFLVWTDADGDGHAADGELSDLASAGLVQISLNGISTEQEWAAGQNIVVNDGSFLRADGSEGFLADVAFQHAFLATTSCGPYDVAA